MLADLSSTTCPRTTCIAELEPWEIRRAPGPVLVAAVHAGHDVRSELVPYLALTPVERQREEDPFTDYWMTVGDTTVRVNRSRFEVDLNRPEKLAVYVDPAQSWGLKVWREMPPAGALRRSRFLHQQFYAQISGVIDDLTDRWGAVLVLDLHSYNHRRQGPGADPENQAANPDIDLGVTTLDPDRFGTLLERFTACLRQPAVDGRQLDVRHNVRYPTGGYFPEWIFRTWGPRVCTVSVEVKKVFMDEWTGTVDVAVCQRVRTLLARAVREAREELGRC